MIKILKLIPHLPEENSYRLNDNWGNNNTFIQCLTAYVNYLFDSSQRPSTVGSFPIFC